MPASNRTLMIISRDSMEIEVTSYRLKLLGFRVVPCGSLATAWALMSRIRPEAALISLDGPDHETLETLEQLGSKPETSDIPILVLGPNPDLEFVERTWKLGATDYLLTPYDPLILEKKVEKLLLFAAARGKAKEVPA